MSVGLEDPPNVVVKKLKLSRETLESFAEGSEMSATTYGGTCGTSIAQTSTCPMACTIGCTDCCKGDTE
jgi:hypothetical protein